MPAVGGPFTNMPMASPAVFAVSTTVGLVVVLVVHPALCTAAPCTVIPTASPVVSEHPTVAVAFSVQAESWPAAKFSLSRVFQVVPPSGEIWKVHPWFDTRSEVRR